MGRIYDGDVFVSVEIIRPVASLTARLAGVGGKLFSEIRLDPWLVAKYHTMRAVCLYLLSSEIKRVVHPRILADWAVA